MSNPLTISLDKFVRSVGVSSDSPHAFFLGAGASISSGVLHAGQCIWEWKRRIFLTNNPGLEEQFSELSLPSSRERIQTWLVDHGYPLEGDVDEYGFYIEECYPVAEHRRRFFQSLIREAKPHTGYRLLCQLALAGICESVWTTNFDGLVARAASTTPGIVPVEVGIDSAQRGFRQPTRGELLCVSLHGDYRYDRLKNTNTELQSQDTGLRRALVSRVPGVNLIVCGYSGRDVSVMEALKEAYAQSGATGELYWCGRGEAEPPPVVADLLAFAREHGRTAYYVPTEGFDDLLVRLSLHCLKGKLATDARAIVTEASQATTPKRAAFTVERLPTISLIKSNAYPVRCPSDVLVFSAELPEGEAWKAVRARAAGHPVVAAPFKGRVIALGTEDGVKDAFSDLVRGTIDRSPVDLKELAFEKGTVVNLFRRALLELLGTREGLATDARRLLWETTPSGTRYHDKRQYQLHEAATVALRVVSGKIYLVIKPTLRVSETGGEEAPREVAKVIKNALLGYQHNDKYHDAVRRWQKHIFQGNHTITLAFPPNCGSTFKFHLDASPAFARIGDPRRGPAITVPAKFDPVILHSGFQLSEPTLLFASGATGAKPVRDEHPMRGIVQNKPYDFALTTTALADRVKVGVICSKPEARRFHDFLSAILQAHPEPKGGQEYVLDFPGFQSAFGVPLHLPANPMSSGWATAPEPNPRADDYATAVELARDIVSQIDALQATTNPNVVAIFIPRRWSSYREPKRHDASFNLHDYLKAQCVRRGIATQLVEEETLEDSQKCRVYWFLSLALYTKSKRTPWVLDGLGEKTAYAGLGLSIDTDANTGQHMVLGCSHIYSSRGEGLRYRLSKVENPIIRRGNPFLPEDDARRLGEAIRQLYFDACSRLPERVVIHKRTPFGREERDGLRQGLSGVEQIDLVEVTFEPELRYIASLADGRGGFKHDRYPVRRGAVVKLDDFSALLWNHGVTNAVVPGRKYYQGKRRIPSPLVITRHAGTAPLETLAREILGLSKMNWNTFDLYTDVPATIASSNAIARIGTMLDRFTEASYDYRLFM